MRYKPKDGMNGGTGRCSAGQKSFWNRISPCWIRVAEPVEESVGWRTMSARRGYICSTTSCRADASLDLVRTDGPASRCNVGGSTGLRR